MGKREKKVHTLRNRLTILSAMLLLAFFWIFIAVTVWKTKKESIEAVTEVQSTVLSDAVDRLMNISLLDKKNVKDEVLQNALVRHYVEANPAGRMVVYQGDQELYNNTSYEIIPPDEAECKSGEIATSIDRDRKLLILYTRAREWDRDFFFYKFVDISGIYTRIRQQIVQELLLSVFLCLLLGITLQIMMRKMFRPLEELRAVSGNIASGEYSSRVQIHEMDEIGQVSNSFNTMAERVEQKITELTRMNEQQNQLLGSLAHELKTPMTALIGYADTLQKLELPPEKKAKALGYISAESRRLAALSEKLLELTGLQKAGKINCDQGISMEKALAHALETVSRKGREKGVRLSFEKKTAGDVTVNADWDLMVTLAVNLLDNAIKASAEDGQVRLVLDAGSFRVEDDSCGICEEELEHIKEAFYMVDKSRSRKQGGAGLGLTLCEQIVRLHGMDWRLESTPGQGTKVTVTFRLQSGEDSAKGVVVG